MIMIAIDIMIMNMYIQYMHMHEFNTARNLSTLTLQRIFHFNMCHTFL